MHCSETHQDPGLWQGQEGRTSRSERAQPPGMQGQVNRCRRGGPGGQSLHPQCLASPAQAGYTSPLPPAPRPLVGWPARCLPAAR